MKSFTICVTTRSKENYYALSAILNNLGFEFSCKEYSLMPDSSCYQYNFDIQFESRKCLIAFLESISDEIFYELTD